MTNIKSTLLLRYINNIAPARHEHTVIVNTFFTIPFIAIFPNRYIFINTVRSRIKRNETYKALFVKHKELSLTAFITKIT